MLPNAYGELDELDVTEPMSRVAAPSHGDDWRPMYRAIESEVVPMSASRAADGTRPRPSRPTLPPPKRSSTASIPPPMPMRPSGPVAAPATPHYIDNYGSDRVAMVRAPGSRGRRVMFGGALVLGVLGVIAGLTYATAHTNDAPAPVARVEQAPVPTAAPAPVAAAPAPAVAAAPAPVVAAAPAPAVAAAPAPVVAAAPAPVVAAAPAPAVAAAPAPVVAAAPAPAVAAAPAPAAVAVAPKPAPKPAAVAVAPKPATPPQPSIAPAAPQPAVAHAAPAAPQTQHAAPATRVAAAPAPAPAPAAKPNAQAAAIAANEGALKISTTVPCEIYVDGKATHKVTPQRSLRLAAGSHSLLLVNDVARVHKEVTVSITAGYSTVVDVATP